MRILIADDDPVSLKLLQRTVERWGHEVATATSGAEAWERLQTEDFPIVLSDWVMPEMDGLELVRRIRGRERPGYVYVILLTVRSEREDVVHGLEAGADDFLRKPFDTDELGARLRAGERIVALQRRLQGHNRALEAANRRMTEDLEAAARVQQAMLPTILPDVPGATFAWRFQPCTELAGDILNVFGLGGGRVGFYLLDVSGHGVSAALMAVSLSRSLVPHPGQSSLLVRAGADGADPHPVTPALVADRLNVRYALRPVRGRFFTLLYGILDPDSRVLTYVSAGHPGAVLLRRGGLEALSATGPPLGIRGGLTFEERTLELRPGDRLYVYSDGLTEARDARGDEFGRERLFRYLEGQRERALEESVAELIPHVTAWRGTDDLDDDASCLALEVDEAP